MIMSAFNVHKFSCYKRVPSCRPSTPILDKTAFNDIPWRLFVLRRRRNGVHLFTVRLSLSSGLASRSCLAFILPVSLLIHIEWRIRTIVFEARWFGMLDVHLEDGPEAFWKSPSIFGFMVYCDERQLERWHAESRSTLQAREARLSQAVWANGVEAWCDGT